MLEGRIDSARRTSVFRTLGLATTSGAVFALAAPPTSLYPTLWVGMVGLSWALAEPLGPPKTRLKAAFTGGARGLAFGAAANLVALRFVVETVTRFTSLPLAAAVVALALLALAQGLRWMATGLVDSWLAARGIPRWASFSVGVYASTFVPAIFPWSPAGGVTPWPAMVQLADLVGERGVSALMALAAGLAAQALRAPGARARRLAALSVAIPAATLLYGVWRMDRVGRARGLAETATVALVQPSITASERWDEERAPAILETLTRLTKSAEGRGADLTVWPEAAYPFAVAHASRFGPIGARAILQPDVHGPVLTGLIMNGGPGVRFNSAVIASSRSALSEPYDKRHLLAFGEMVPFAQEIPWLRRTFSRGTGLVPGTRGVLLRAGPVRARVLNCFEDTLPESGREPFEDGPKLAPNLLVNVTNDAWFSGSQETELHLRLSVLRAVETRRDLVRAVNLGATSWIDATGRIRARYDLAAAGILLTQPALLDGPATPYADLGDTPCLMVFITGLGVVLRRRRTRASTPQNAKDAAP